MNKTAVAKNIKFIYDIESENLTMEIIEKLIEKHKILVNNRFKILENYFEGKHAILNRIIKDDKPNNKNVFNYCRYIVDQLTGYFLGKAVTYDSDNSKLIEDILANFKLNNEELENNNLAHKASVKGTAYELCYIDENAEFRFKSLDTDSIILILDSTINNNINFAIRYYTIIDLEDEEKLYVEVYTKDKIFKYAEGDDGLALVEAQEHYFGEVPIVEFNNNRYRTGDFEFIIDINDSINKLKNDVANDLDYYSNCLLALTGIDGTDEKAVKKLESKENRTMLLPENSKAQFITKNINNNVVEYYNKSLSKDLHLLAGIPDLTDLNITSDMKATAIKSMFFSTEQIVAEKERQFKVSLEKRIRLFCNFSSKKSTGADWRDVEIQFNRNIPVNLSEFGDSVIKLKGTLPDEMLLEELKKAGLDIDVDRAMALINKERELYKLNDSIQDLRSDTDE